MKCRHIHKDTPENYICEDCYINDIVEALETKDEDGMTNREKFKQMETNNEMIAESYKDLYKLIPIKELKGGKTKNGTSNTETN